jgi:bifunctional lysine-specific demethylase and histidyl-hydroxylase NO66
VHDPDGRPGERRIVAELAPGDCLYIPQRFPHAAWTADTTSVHLTVGVVPTTWADVLRQAVAAALEGTLSREPLPAGFAADPGVLRDGLIEQLGEVRRRLEKLDAAAIAEAAADRFWSSRPPILTGQLQQLVGLEEIGEGTVVRRRPRAVCHLREREDRLEVLLGDRVLHLPARLAPAMRRILASDRLVVADLADLLDPPGRLVLIRRLVREGLLESLGPSPARR